MIGTVYEWLATASVLLIVLLGILISMAIRRRRNGGNGNTLFTVLGIAAALDFMLLGVLIPKALLVRAEDRYLAVEWTQDSGGNTAIEPRTTAAPLPGEGHEIELVWLWEALALIQDENELSLREPISFEMSMEQAAQTARNELDLLSALGALTGLDKDDLHFKSGELRGRPSASFESEMGSSPGMPWGLWIITFEDSEGRPVEVKCDSQNGCVYSVAFRRDAEVSDFVCFSTLIGYAKYFGLPMQGAVLDTYNAETYTLTANGVPLGFIESDSRGMTVLSFFVSGEQQVGMQTPMPTAVPTPTPTPEPTKTPKPAPTSTSTPIPAATATPVPSGEPEGTPGN